MARKQNGFTLVEIAIVLVIIGLLLGGILKGQQLINSARVRNIADTNSGIQAAYYGFLDRYRQVPGDMPAAAATTAIGLPVNNGGNGNGRVDQQDFGEASAMWEQLSQSDFIQGNYTGGATDAPSYKVQPVAPVNPFNGFYLLARTRDYSSYDGPNDTRVAPAATAPPLRLGLVLGDNIPVSIARELDVKIDDQVPLTGVLRYTGVNGEMQSFKGVSESTSTVTECISPTVGGTTTVNAWNVASQAQNCNLVYLY